MTKPNRNCELPIKPSDAGRHKHQREGTPVCERCRKSAALYGWMHEHPDADRQDWPGWAPTRVSPNLHCAKPVEASGAGRIKHIDDGTPVCDRCRESARLYQKELRGRERSRRTRTSSKNPHCDLPVAASSTGRRWHQTHGEEICPRCRASEALYQQVRRARIRKEDLREKVKAPKQLTFTQLYNRRRQLMHSAEWIGWHVTEVATYPDYDYEDLASVREELILTRDIIEAACKAFDLRADVERLKLRIEKLRALEASSEAGEAEAARVARVRAETKLRLIHGGVANDPGA